MKTIQKQTVTVLATIALFSSVALADGEMGGGGLTTFDTPADKAVVRTHQDGQLIADNTTYADEFGLNWLLSAMEEVLGLS